jgi:iron complex outermembrane receptor protein
LFGRNTIGGLINVTSTRPSTDRWTGSVLGGPFGNVATVDTRGSFSGPLDSGRLGLGIGFGYSARDGFTTNDLTGNDLDSRSAAFTKGQLLWTPSSIWEARFIVSGERARDGDYALSDLGTLRSEPFRTSRDYEGFNHRDIVAPTVLLRRTGQRFEFASTTGFVRWKTLDSTDLDYSPLPAATRDNDERDFQFTQEVRLASSRDAGIQLSPDVMLRWQTGVFVFTQDYEQDAVNHYNAFVLSPMIDFPVTEHSPEASLDDRGIGVYGQGTFAIGSRFEGAVGVRGDYESKSAVLRTFYEPQLPAGTTLDQEKGFGDVSPQFTAAYHVTPESAMLYGRVARGFKAGGFNAASPSGSEAYDGEHSWSYEGGAKTAWFENRLALNAAAFYLTWDDLQVNIPNELVLGQFFIGNAAGATSKGVELEMNARAFVGCDFFAGFGYTNTRFDDESESNGVVVGGNRLSNTPTYTADFGGQYTIAVTPGASLYARAEVAFRGHYYYDDANTEGQDAYSLANFKFGLRGRRLFAEGWLRNAFDSRYFPVAFAYRSPSGFIGETGAPRTFGVRAGVTF